jgi:uncharacterized protein YdaU (DUF1376 family)
MADLPDPLMPADCDLRDFAFMPLDIQRLRRSKAWLKAKRNPVLAFYMVNLWTAAWHDVPAGSLEDDDDVLADLAMCDPAKWAKLKADVLHGWIKCSDGRLYNPTTCEKARESWDSKVERREKEANERDRKRREREERSSMFADLREVDIVPAWNIPTRDLRALHSSHVTTGHAPVRVTGSDSHGDSPGESRLRQGQGQGQGQGQDKTPPPIPPDGGLSEPIQEKTKKRSAIALQTFLDECKAKGEKPILENDSVFSYADETGIPIEFLRLHWLEFKVRYCEPDAKRYKNWRLVYRKCVRANWFRFWFFESDGTCALTTAGEQARRIHKKDTA